MALAIRGFDAVTTGGSGGSCPPEIAGQTNSMQQLIKDTGDFS